MKRTYSLAGLVFFALAFAPSVRAQENDAENKPIDPRFLKLKRGPSFPTTAPVRPKLAFPQQEERTTPSEGTPDNVPPPPDTDDTGEPGLGDIKRTAGVRCRPLRANDRVQFEFKNADIKDVVAAISKTMCKNFIITSKVRGQKFDILSPTEITVDEAWRAFLSSLEANDIGVTLVGKYYKLFAAQDGARTPVPLYGPRSAFPNTDQIVTKIWKLDHSGDINAVVNYLNIFKSTKGQVHPFASTNTIVATDFGTSIRRLEDILREIDAPGALERIHVVPVQYATASEIGEKLTQIFEPQKAGAPSARRGGSPAQNMATPGRIPVTPQSGDAASQGQVGEEEAAPSVSKIIADDRTNKLIIICSEGAFKQIMALKRQLDTPADSEQGQVQVLHLRNADAEELASTLSSLAQGRPTTPGRRTAGSRQPAQQNVPKPPGQTGATSAALFEGEVKITADKPTNSLVITAAKSDFNALKRVIDQLDVARLQVFVEAVILEVAVTRDRDLGVTWHGGVNNNIGGEDVPLIFSSAHREFSSLSLTSNPIAFASLLGFAGTVRGPALEGTEDLVAGGVPSIGVVLQALQSSNDVNVISTPHLLTMDNEEAEIQVNEKRPFPSGLTLGGGLGGLAGLAGGAAGAGLPNLGGLGLGSVSFNREDVGLTLKLKPTIHDQEMVRLELDQEQSDVAGTDQVTGQVITAKRAAKTVVVVRDQESVVIGGLVRDRETKNESKIPLLGDLPILGWLFKKQERTTEKVNLILVLTPYIIRSSDDFRKIYERKMEERRKFVEYYYGDSKEYRAAIDWDKKVGPLGSYRKKIRDELLRPENEGPGAGEDTVIRDGEVIGDAPGESGAGQAVEPDPSLQPGVLDDSTTPQIDSPEAPDLGKNPVIPNDSEPPEVVE